MKQYLVIGVGRFGTAVATTLYELGHEVVVIDNHEAMVEALMNNVTQAVIGDATDEAILEELDVSSFDSVVVAIGQNLEANVLATVAAKNCGAKHVISKASSILMAKVLAKVGADEVVRPENDMGIKLAVRLSTPQIANAIELDDQHSIAEVEVQDKLQGSLIDLRLPDHFGVQVIVVKRSGHLHVNPKADFEVVRGDILVVIGRNQAIGRLRHHLRGG